MCCLLGLDSKVKHVIDITCHLFTYYAISIGLSPEATMRSSLSRTVWQLGQNACRIRTRPCRVAGARWSSSESGHKWSTPLAKQLAEAITVRQQ